MYRLFYKEAAEDVTSMVFLTVAGSIRDFEGHTEDDFRNWVYAIAANHANAYIRKTSRRKQLFEKAALSMMASDADSSIDSPRPDWLTVYTAILKLKPEHQTIVTLRFFENMDFEQIGKVINAREVTVRVTLHRILKKLKTHLRSTIDGEL